MELTTTFVYDPPKLRRPSRRTKWQCRVDNLSEERFHRGAAIRVAAQAVAAHHFGIQVRELVCASWRRHATLDADWKSLTFPRRDSSIEARNALEHDCITIYAGIVARAIILGWSHTTYGWDDQDLVCDLLDRLEYDVALKTSWHDYQRERARLFVTHPVTWTQIEVLAARLREELVMDKVRVSAVLESVDAEHAIVPSQVSWHFPTPGEPSNAVLVWQEPGLTEILARAAARLSADDGDDQ